LDVADPRSKTQQSEGQQVADDQRRLTRQLQAERHQREAAAKSQGAAGIEPSRATEPGPAASAPRKKKGLPPSKDVAPDSTTARAPPAPMKPAR
jgi:hypothetical protein